MQHMTCFVADEETPRSRLAVLLEHFSRLDDEREPWRVMYPLSEMLLLLTCATIACATISTKSSHGASIIWNFCGSSHRFISAFPASAGCARWLTAWTRSCSGVVSKAGSRTCGLTGTI